ncbi:MAG: hypothetical protein N3E41_01370 [Thermofilaceae archaeon]|nr:hypothetical protein [Thermofilaceae archaeon]
MGAMIEKGRRRRVEKLAAYILYLASRDLLGGVGRVLVRELEAEGYSYDEIVEALNLLRSEGYSISVVGEVIKVDLDRR